MDIYVCLNERFNEGESEWIILLVTQSVIWWGVAALDSEYKLDLFGHLMAVCVLQNSFAIRLYATRYVI